jgi:hypothetical protein
MKKIKLNYLVLWFISKLNLMKNAGYYVGALKYQKTVFDILENFVIHFNETDTQGYLFSENRTENSIDIIMGCERFTIVSNIQLHGKIIFDVFGWEFDLSSLTRYTSKRIDQLTMIKEGSSLIFRNVVYGYDNTDFKHILTFNDYYPPDLILPFFDQIEIYINQKNDPKAMIAY